LRNNPVLAVLSLIVAALMLGTMVPLNSFAQQVPPRGYQLQEYRRISPAPLSAAQRVKREVIKATNPENGAVDVRILSRPDVPRPAWYGPTRSGSPRAVSRPDIPRPRWQGPSRSGNPVATPAPPQTRPGFSSVRPHQGPNGAQGKGEAKRTLIKPTISCP